MQGIIDSISNHATECIAFLCGDAYLAPGQHRHDCVAPVDCLNFGALDCVVPESALLPSRKRTRATSGGAGGEDNEVVPSSSEAADQEARGMESWLRSNDAFGTWLVAQSEMVLVIRDPRRILVYIPSCDMCYVGDPELCIVTDQCPPSSVFRGQFFIEAGLPRLLIFDVVRLGGVAMRGVPPHERYAKLQAGWFGGAVVLQWCGLTYSLRDSMAAGRFVVPHEVLGIVEFTEDPMCLRACCAMRRGR